MKEDLDRQINERQKTREEENTKLRQFDNALLQKD
jgi:hypothetical protein